MGFPGGANDLKNPPTNAEDIIEEDLIPEQEDSLEEGM